MNPNDRDMIGLMDKYTRQQLLTDQEWRALEQWWKALADNRDLARKAGYESVWIEELVESRNKVRQKELWAAITSQLKPTPGTDEGKRKIRRGGYFAKNGAGHLPYHLQLADGSRVWLDSGVRFECTNNSRETAHPYRLVGKALFNSDSGRLPSNVF